MSQLIEPLNGYSFNQIIYNSDRAWFVFLHIPWCGYCIRFRDKLTRFIADSTAWSNLVRFASLDCQAENLCTMFGIDRYPALLFVPRYAHPMIGPKLVTAKELFTLPILQILVDCLSSAVDHALHWPHLLPISSYEIRELGSRNDFRFVVIVDMDPSDPVSRAIMFDFSRYESVLPIFRTTYDQIAQSGVTATPPAMIFFDNDNKHVSRIDHSNEILNEFSENVEETRNRLRFHFRQVLIGVLQRQQFQQQSHGIDFFSSLEPSISFRTKPRKRRCVQRLPERFRRHIFMDELESCLHYMFRVEIPGRNVIDSAKIAVIQQWVKFLCLFFPGRRHVRKYLFLLDEQLEKLNGPILGQDFASLSRIWQFDAYLPDKINWFHCRGSEEHYRGYPCAVWTLFHVLTVSHYNHAHEADQLGFHYSGADLIRLFTNYIISFFSCSQCADHFKLSTADSTQKLPNPHDHAIMYMWKLHNHVNQHIAGDITEDPCAPKRQFPDETDCVGCFRQTSNGKILNEQSVFSFLLQFYGSHNIIK